MLTKILSIGSYSPEVRSFGTLINFSLIIGQPRDLTILYLDIVDSTLVLALLCGLKSPRKKYGNT